MTIPTQLRLVGFIATAPELTFTGQRHARLYCRVGTRSVEFSKAGITPSGNPRGRIAWPQLGPRLLHIVTTDRF